MLYMRFSLTIVLLCLTILVPGQNNLDSASFNSRLLEIKTLGKTSIESALTQFESLLEHPDVVNNPTFKCQTFYEMGTLYKFQSEFEEAISTNKKGALIARNNNDPERVADFANQLGTMYSEQAKSEQAIQQYFSAIEPYEKLGLKRSLSQVYTNIGIEYANLENSEKAMENYRKSLQIKRELNDSTGAGRCFINMGLEQMYMDQYDSAIVSLNLALELLKSSDNAFYNGIIFNNLGLTYFNMGDLNTSKEYYLQSIREIEKTDNRRSLSATYNNLAEIALKLEQYNEAIEFSNQAIELSIQVGSKPKLLDAYQTLSRSYEATGRYEEALTYFRSATQIKDSIANENVKKNIDELETRYETAKNERRISDLNYKQHLSDIELDKSRFRNLTLYAGLGFLFLLLLLLGFNYLRSKRASERLRQKNIQIEEKNRIIEQSLEEKEMLIREVHHRVKNNLEIISSLIELQTVGMSNDDVLLETIKNWQSRIDSIALIHNNLYKTEDLSSVPLQSYLEKLSSNIASIYEGKHPIKTEIQASSLRANIDRSIPIGLIVNELISNAYKHAFPKRAGRIKVTLARITDHQIELKIWDDGIGLPDDFHFEETESLGLKLVKILVRQIKGQLVYQNNIGAEFKIIFPNSGWSE